MTTGDERRGAAGAGQARAANGAANYDERPLPAPLSDLSKQGECARCGLPFRASSPRRGAYCASCLQDLWFGGDDWGGWA